MIILTEENVENLNQKCMLKVGKWQIFIYTAMIAAKIWILANELFY